ncbi:glycosyltransferase family 4 protein [Pseudoalteromonas sp. SR43-3]|uniref:glycosyltransferase family 4 protein n=1 Tax=Pseudoalteromonas sp. SR43-3 TaxID=2760943 RepID=UPI0016028A23|nr:glycosyltransferase [Pseudoalteromonas sp. SR43-3]MBB1275950.1 glycosyltransferase [Pseudoalteromonas sp. SR43-3]
MCNGVIFIGPLPEPIHGMSLLNQYLVSELKGENFSLDVIRSNFESVLKDKDQQGKLKLKEILFSLKILLDFIKSIQSKKDVVYITPGQSVLGFLKFSPIILLSYLFKKKVILHLHGSKLAENVAATNYFTKQLIINLLTLSWRVIFLGPSIQDKHLLLLKDRSKGAYCFNGVPIKNFAAKKKSKKLKILFLSNLMKDKGVFDFFEAVSILKGNGHQLEVNMAGAIEASHFNKINNLIASCEIKYHGVVSGDYKDKLFSEADVFCLPSYDEGQPLSILEAYMSGCAVITTNVGGISDIFKCGVNGYFCDVSTPKSIASCIEKMTPTTLLTFQNNNYAQAIDKYTLDCFLKRMKTLLFEESFK